MGIAREGYPLIFAAAAVTVTAWMGGLRRAAGALALGTAGVAAFFRDPERLVPQGEGLIVAPADGRIMSIARVDANDFMPAPSTRISIFLSPLDVHINRMPVAGVVEATNYRTGKFIAAYKDDSSAQNEQNALRLVDERGRRFGVVQVAGVMARRIVCHAKTGDQFARGDRFGMIMFGSRTDAYLPVDCRVEVAPGQHVVGGETIVGRFP
jgi:phosphatidylserine decarboxylase